MCLSVVVHNPSCLLAEGRWAGHEWNVVHNAMGFRCGYVKVLPGHPWHGRGYDKIRADIHGGLTFGQPDVACNKGGPDNGYWVGFDCAHSNDAPDPALSSSDPELARMLGQGTVRTQQYAEAECRRLCEQARDAQAS